MYHSAMEKIRNALKEVYSPVTVRAILRGDRRPSFDKMVQLQDKHGIPLDAWRDIRQWLEKQSEEGEEKVARAGTKTEEEQ